MNNNDDRAGNIDTAAATMTHTRGREGRGEWKWQGNEQKPPENGF